MSDQPGPAEARGGRGDAKRGDRGDAKRGGSLARVTAIMSVGTAASRITGFARIGVMAWAIGGAESKLPDTYSLANSMPNIVYQLVIGEILATVLVPVFVEHLKLREDEESQRLASSILTLALVAGAAFAAITVLAAPWLIKIYTFRITDPATRAAQEHVGAFLLRLFMPQMIFYAAGAVMTSLLNAHRRFAAPMFAPVLNNCIVAATFITFRIVHGGRTPDLASLTSGDKLLLGGGTTLGVIAMTMVLWPFVRALPGRYRLGSFDLRHPAIRHVGTLAKYSFGYVIVNQIGLWVADLLANGVRGGVAAYEASWILYQLPYGIFAVSVMTALGREIAEHSVHGDLAAIRREVSLGLRTTAFVVLPAAAGFIALAHPIIRLLLQHGVFGAASTDLFARTLVLMAIGLGAYAAFQQIMRTFYAMQDTKTPLIVNTVAVATNVVTAFPLFHLLRVPGLALSHALSYIVGAITGGVILRRRLGGLDTRRLASAHIRIGVAALATGLVSWEVARLIGARVALASFGGQVLQVGGAVTAGLAVYIGAALVFHIDEFRPIVDAIRARTNRSPSP